MDIREWNIGMAATIPSNKGYELQPWIINEITKGEPDCIVLTEFAVSKGIDYFFETLEKKDYHWFISATTKQNGILLALKRSTFDFSCTFDYKKSTVKNTEALEKGGLPDFLEVVVGWEEKLLSIIGTRIRVDLDEGNNNSWRGEFASLDSYLASKENTVICVGDFNAFWPGIWKNKSKNHTLPSTSDKYFLYTPSFNEGEWWSYVNPKVTEYGGKCQLDHLITNISGRELKVNYDWSFIEERPEYKSIKAEDKYKPSGLPDHAILKATVS